MIYAIVSGILRDFFFYILQHLFPLAVIIRVEDVITALPYPKGRWYFDAVALPKGIIVVYIFRNNC